MSDAPAPDADEASEEEDVLVDKTQCSPIPQVKIVLLVNNFIINSVELINTFAVSCEDKLAAVARRISGVELGLALLEAKLNSVPGVADGTTAPPSRALVTTTAAAAPADDTAAPADDAAAPTPEPEPEPEEEEPVYLPPELVRFAKMIKMGVPEGQVRLAMGGAGVDPDVQDQIVSGELTGPPG